ncbi:hypothetical protein BDV06DRAFT_230898 [Aspergillus oleicola]
MNQMVPDLFLGDLKSSFEVDLLCEKRINVIVPLTDARWTRWNCRTRKAGILESHHKWTQCADTSYQDLLIHMTDACDLIEEMATPVLKSSATLVHCEMGNSRSATFIMAYLMRKYEASLEAVYDLVWSKSRIIPRANFIRQLQIWGLMKYQIWQDEEKTVPKPLYREYLDDRALFLKCNGVMEKEPLAAQVAA